MINIFRVILGFILITPAIIYSIIFKTRDKNYTYNTWTHGLFKNVFISYRRYDTKSWARRLLCVFKNPKIVDQYLKILTTKKKVVLVGKVNVNIANLIPSHDVCTDHEHHRNRVRSYKDNIKVDSFSPIIVVDNVIHDGHHRITAMIEAGIKETEVLQYKEI